MKAQKWMPLVVIAAGLLAYYNSFTGPFIFDDVPSIQENLTIRHLWPIWRPLSPPHNGGITVEGRPLINLSFAVNYAFGGAEVRGYHLVNLMIHILAGLTLLAVVRRTLLQPKLRERFGAAADGLALAVAVLWTAHPLQTESVTYIVQRAESIVGLFYLLTLYCFIRGTASPLPRWWYTLCLSSCALGMASKEVMASAPLMVLLYDRTFVSGSFEEAWRRRRSLYVALAATWILLGYFVFIHGNYGNAANNARITGIGRWPYLLAEPGVILHYLHLSVWPNPLCFDYYGWPLAGTGLSVLLPVLAVALLLGLIALSLKANSAWGFVGAWFFLILAPSSSVIPLDSPAYEHRMYLPLATAVTLMVMGIYTLLGRRSVPVFLGLAAGLVFLTTQRNEVYRSELSIWSDTVAKRPNNARAHYNLGNDLAAAGRVPEAIGHYQQALRLKENNPEAHTNLGLALFGLGRRDEAMEQWEWALRLNPDFAAAHNNLGNALLALGKAQEAIDHFEQALRSRPDGAELHYNVGNALVRLGKRPEAIAQWEWALRLDPDFAPAHNNLGNALLGSGKVQDALGHFEQALRSKPDDAEVRYNVGNALARLGRRPEAMDQWEWALRLNPDLAEAHSDLGLALEQTGKVPEAITHYEQALRIKPDSSEVQNNLAWLLATLTPSEGGDPTRAVTLAERICKLTNNRAVPYLDTLAAAYASAGRFNDAVTSAQKAIDLANAAGLPQVAKQIEPRLQLYRNGQAYRRAVAVTNPPIP